MIDAAVLLAKAVFYIGGLTAIGISLHMAVGLSTPSTRSLRFAGVLLGLALILRLLSLNAEIMGAWGQALNFSMFGWIWPGVRAQTIAMSLGVLCFVFAQGRTLRFFAAIGALVTAAGFGLAGHTQALDTPGLAPVAVILHVVIAGFWWFAPVSLWPRAGIDNRQLAWRMDRFSQLAIWAVPLMFALGLWLSVQISGSISSVFGTSYGRLLLLKLFVAALALTIGALNKIYLTRALRAGHRRARTMLRYALFTDLLLFTIAVFAVAAATTLFGPH
ncbi:MAG: copper resistance D family protein [Litorimonas sp.]